MGKLIHYIGPKSQKQVLWMEGKPVFNKGNDFICEVSDNDAARVLKTCPSIFELLEGGDPPKKVIRTRKPPIEEKPVQEEVVAEEMSHRLYGKVDGSHFDTEMGAKSQVPRVAENLGIDRSDLETIGFSDGWWIRLKEKEEQNRFYRNVEMMDEQEGAPPEV